MDPSTSKLTYLHDPSTVEKFNKNYLSTLQVYLNDTGFKQKVSALPELTSATTIKFEKIIEKYGVQQKQAERRFVTLHTPHPVSIRYIIVDPEDRPIDVNNIDENFELNKKIPNPYKALLEDSDKVRKQAIEQILNNALTKESENNVLSVQEEKVHEIDKKQFGKDSQISSEYLMNRYEAYLSPRSNLTRENAPVRRDSLDRFMKGFKEACDANNFITNDQKIDYFVYLRSNKEKERETPLKNHKLGSIKIETNGNIMASNKKKEKSSNFNKEKDGNYSLTSNVNVNICTNSNKPSNITVNMPNIPNVVQTNAVVVPDANMPVDSIIKNPGLINFISMFNSFNNTHESKETPSKNININNSASGLINDKKPTSESKPRNLIRFYKAKTLLHVFNRYSNELRNKFKITDEASSNRHFEVFYEEIESRINNFKKCLKDNSEYSKHYIEKIKQMVSCKEISLEKVTLRDCDISPDRFYFLLTKKTFDFRVLTVSILLLSI